MSRVKIDELDLDSREFYERAKLKLTFSLFLAAIGMMFLGFASSFGGQSNSASQESEFISISGTIQDSVLALAGGYGFATFASMLAFILSIAGAIYVSPLVSSLQERKILSNPENITFSDSISTSNIAISVSVPPTNTVEGTNNPRFAQPFKHEVSSNPEYPVSR